jgi:hypothetical protein
MSLGKYGSGLYDVWRAPLLPPTLMRGSPGARGPER